EEGALARADGELAEERDRRAAEEPRERGAREADAPAEALDRGGPRGVGVDAEAAIGRVEAEEAHEARERRRGRDERHDAVARRADPRREVGLGREGREPPEEGREGERGRAGEDAPRGARSAHGRAAASTGETRRSAADGSLTGVLDPDPELLDFVAD